MFCKYRICIYTRPQLGSQCLCRGYSAWWSYVINRHSAGTFNNLPMREIMMHSEMSIEQIYSLVSTWVTFITPSNARANEHGTLCTSVRFLSITEQVLSQWWEKFLSQWEITAPVPVGFGIFFEWDMHTLELLLKRFIISKCYGPLTRYEKLRVAHAAGMPGTLSSRHRLQRKLLVSDPGIHHNVCRDRKPAMAGKTFPAFPAHAQPTILRIWREAHSLNLYTINPLGHMNWISYWRIGPCIPQSKFE